MKNNNNTHTKLKQVANNMYMKLNFRYFYQRYFYRDTQTIDSSFTYLYTMSQTLNGREIILSKH